MADNKQPAQLEFFTVPSPCIGVCQSGPKGYCKGCFRSREERLYWLQIDDATRKVILNACQRRKRYHQRKTRQDSGAEGPRPVQTDLFDENENSQPTQIRSIIYPANF